VACDVPDLLSAERLLSALVTSNVTPVAVELVTGPAWNSAVQLILGIEGTEAEVSWMIETLTAEWSALGIPERQVIEDEIAESLWAQLREFPVNRDAPLVLKASLRPSGVCSFVSTVQQIDPNASILAHAGNGIVVVRFAKFEASDLSRQLVGRLQPLARQNGGHVLILSSNGLGELTRQAQWGGVEDEVIWMSKIKTQFDPQNVLNPGRFVFENL
jgi:glycolate oxidase FAD binding subunit